MSNRRKPRTRIVTLEEVIEAAPNVDVVEIEKIVPTPEEAPQMTTVITEQDTTAPAVEEAVQYFDTVVETLEEQHVEEHHEVKLSWLQRKMVRHAEKSNERAQYFAWLKEERLRKRQELADYYAWENAERLRAQREHEARMSEQRVMEERNNLNAEIAHLEAKKAETWDHDQINDKIKVARVKSEVKINKIRHKTMDRRAKINQKIEDLQEQHKVRTAKRNAALQKVKDKLSKKIARNNLFVERIKSGVGIVAGAVAVTTEQQIKRIANALGSGVITAAFLAVAVTMGWPILTIVFATLLAIDIIGVIAGTVVLALDPAYRTVEA